MDWLIYENYLGDFLPLAICVEFIRRSLGAAPMLLANLRPLPDHLGSPARISSRSNLSQQISSLTFRERRITTVVMKQDREEKEPDEVLKRCDVPVEGHRFGGKDWDRLFRF